MPQSLTKVFVHITFSTKHRYPFIDSGIEQELWAYLGGVCKALECNPIRVGGYDDHIHICCLLSKKITQIKLLEEIKKQSSNGKWNNSFHRAMPYAIDLWAFSPKLLKKLSKPVRTIENNMKKLKEIGILSRIGSDKTGHWEIKNHS